VRRATTAALEERDRGGVADEPLDEDAEDEQPEELEP